uniref:Chromo domain-containing protein n=1 Tax=Trichogramma kaykai TaxID=54128 RepID=A0ABD2XFV7_9HYME
MTPASVNLYNAAEARKNLKQRYDRTVQRKLKYKVGDLVRVSRAKNAFAKGYEGGWTIELFKIYRISETRKPSVYYLKDLADEPIEGFFYEEELTRVRKDLNNASFEIEAILDTRGKGRKKEYFVHWRGYPDKFNSWEPAAPLDYLKKNKKNEE